MKRHAVAIAIAIAIAIAVPGVARAAPAGEVLQFRLAESKVFPGSERDYFVYVPGQYRPQTPACLYLGQDGLPGRSAEVVALFDRLIQQKRMPITIGVFVMPGVIPAAGGRRPQRSLEYDSVGDAYVRFLVEDLLPDVEKRQSSDGRALHLSPEPDCRAIGGEGSGAVAAFTAAWERPGAFRRVYSARGAYVGLRGAGRYADHVRLHEPKPIRVFLESESESESERQGADHAGLDAFAGNLALLRALKFAGYDVGTATRRRPGLDGLATALRFLWRDWPRPVPAGRSRNPVLSEILIPGEDWHLVGEGYRFTEGPTVNRQGEVFFNDIPNAKTYQVELETGITVRPYLEDSQKANGQAFGPDGRLYTLPGGPGKVLAYDQQRRPTTLAEGFHGNDIVVAHNGNLYLTNPPDSRNPSAPSNVWLIRPNGDKQIVDTGLRYANGITLSPDQTRLYVDDHRSRWVMSYEVQSDGTLKHEQRFCALQLLDHADDTSADGMKVDRQGRVYVATRTGLLQICDPLGRVRAILATPNRRISNLTFGGKDFDRLVVTAGDRVWTRRLRVTGANAWAPPLPAE